MADLPAFTKVERLRFIGMDVEAFVFEIFGFNYLDALEAPGSW